MLARCTSSLDLHLLIVPLWYLFRTLLVPKVALGNQAHFQLTTYHFKYRRARESCFGLTGAEIAWLNQGNSIFNISLTHANDTSNVAENLVQLEAKCS